MNLQSQKTPDRYSCLRRLGVIAVLVVLPVVLVWGLQTTRRPARAAQDTPDLSSGWRHLAGNRLARLIYARPPHLMILDLSTGTRQSIDGIQVAGGSGRRGRGKTPRPQWHPDGRRFLYRHAGKIHLADRSGNIRQIYHPQMNAADETRWSWYAGAEGDWAVGPDRKGHVLMIDTKVPHGVRWLYRGGDVKRWCEMTGDGRHLVFWDGRDVRLASIQSFDFSKPVTSSRRISSGQACRPAAAPRDWVAWLPSPHTHYNVYDARFGKPLAPIKAPPGEEIYRLNWSNDPDYVVHMYGSTGNTRMHVQRLSTGQRLYVGEGWDPDLWIGP